MVTHRLSRWFIIVLVAMLAAPVHLLAQEVTPVSGDTQLYIGHAARLTAEIPAEWTPVSQTGFTYGHGAAVFTSNPMLEQTFAEACDATAFDSSDGKITITETTWNDAPACKVDIATSITNGRPLKGMVLTHPEPFNFQGITISFVSVFATPENFDDILPTVSFDISTLTGPEIAHSILDVAEVNTYYANGVDWAELRAGADDILSPDAVTDFLRNMLVPALRNAGDIHSFLMPNIDPAMGGSPFTDGPPSGEMRGNLGYIEIPSGALPVDWDAYVEGGLATVEELEPHACGWIIDLRGNGGGSVPIMVQSLLPFFPEGNLFGFVDAAGSHAWVSRDGDRLMYAREGILAPYAPAFDTPLPSVTNPDAPIAVLTSRHTGSAGEYTLLTLTGRPNTRSFGQATAGYTTGNAGFTMLDGSTLALAGAAAVDTDGNVYTGQIEPDEPIFSQARGGAQGQDDTILAAEEWLLQQPACLDSATPVD